MYWKWWTKDCQGCDWHEEKQGGSLGPIRTQLGFFDKPAEPTNLDICTMGVTVKGLARRTSTGEEHKPRHCEYIAVKAK